MKKHAFIFDDVYLQASSQTVLFLMQTFSDGSFISSKTIKLSKVSLLYPALLQKPHKRNDKN